MRGLIFISFLCASCGSTPATSTSTTPRPAERSPWTDDAALGVQSPELRELLTDHWERAMRIAPEWATRLGDHRYDDRIHDPSWETVLEERRATRGFLERARAIEGLSDADATTRDLLVERFASSVAREVCESPRWNLSAMHNPLTQYNRLPQLTETLAVRDGENLVARYRAVPAAIDAHIANLRAGAGEGRFTNATTARRVVEMFRGQLEQPIAEWPLLAPRGGDRPEWSEQQRSRFDAELTVAVEDGIRPAYARFADFVETEILPHAHDDEHAGVGELPDGAACYAAQIRTHISRDTAPQELHDLGLREIARINAEMQSLGQRLFETDDLRAILSRLRDDESLYFDTEEEVEAAANAALAAARERMGSYFGVLPEAPCVVVRVPEYEAPFTTIAYYRPPNPDGSKPGEYFINTSEPQTRPRFAMQVLAFHEAIPGHHLQLAIQQELEAMPAFRRHSFLTVYIEGWALYTERLAGEMELYGGDLDRMGMLSYDAWRAARLVVDTGLHSMGWSRERAERYMSEHTGLAANNVTNEIDRYISWPGQALAYKVGQLEILRLREVAREALGESFDLAEFHDAVLTSGAVTMPILETQVRAWIASRTP